MNFEFKSIEMCVERSIRKIILNDSFLIRDGQERALSIRVGVYLYQELSGWDVDCEYNKIESGNENKCDSSGGARLPDIIIHQRGRVEIENNLLWVEVKIFNNAINGDLKKISEFTARPSGDRKIQYRYGLSISFLPNLKLIWIKDGEPMLESNCPRASGA